MIFAFAVHLFHDMVIQLYLSCNNFDDTNIHLSRQVGSLKSAPFFAVTNACVAWLAFGIQLQDLVIILPNAMGLGLSA